MTARHDTALLKTAAFEHRSTSNRSFHRHHGHRGLRHRSSSFQAPWSPGPCRARSRQKFDGRDGVHGNGHGYGETGMAGAGPAECPTANAHWHQQDQATTILRSNVSKIEVICEGNTRSEHPNKILLSSINCLRRRRSRRLTSVQRHLSKRRKGNDLQVPSNQQRWILTRFVGVCRTRQVAAGQDRVRHFGAGRYGTPQSCCGRESSTEEDANLAAAVAHDGR